MRNDNTEHLDAPGIKSPGKPHSKDFFCTIETGGKNEKQRKTASSCIINLETEAGLAEQLQTGSGTSWHIGTVVGGVSSSSYISHLLLCICIYLHMHIVVVPR